VKIEKISDTQIKFVLNKSDLSDRNIKLSELAYGSEKTQELFHEMMDQAFIEYGFKSENAPLMIEAIPVTLDSIIVLVTKVSHNKDKDMMNRLNLFSNNESTPKNNVLNNNLNNSLNNIMNTNPKSDILIYSFKSLEDITSISIIMKNYFKGSSSVYKDNGIYFLILEDLHSTKIDLNNILGEYAKKHISTLKSKYYLIEHGEVIIKESAIEKFALI